LQEEYVKLLKSAKSHVELSASSERVVALGGFVEMCERLAKEAAENFKKTCKEYFGKINNEGKIELDLNNFKILNEIMQVVQKVMVPTSDKSAFGKEEHWEFYNQTYRSVLKLEKSLFKDDCDGYAILFWSILRSLGISNKDMSLLYLENIKENDDGHLVIVLNVKVNGEDRQLIFGLDTEKLIFASEYLKTVEKKLRPKHITKAEALQEWLKNKKELAGGIAVQDGPNGWKLQSNKKYKYTPSFDGWDNLKDLL
jgi:predicted transglutaminase-like cysteine proteinase